ncbi:glycerol-3-phosphate 1-O-acyltransferase PlsY [Lentimicrobium sp. L6]|nr:glycerol-3-phosphate 1-O-acyltransferase PlsY [Lentimicrobium sp. S6]NPD83513.1 glycerol-3-phosphate 1-O-acyltransferase PlsY [Lentimicrobium sp. L6]
MQLLLGLIISYLLGSIPTSVWVGKWFYKTDVREHGSGNAGATNTIRVLGYYAGIPVLLFDMAKAWFPVWAVVNLLVWHNLTFDLVYIQIGFGLAAVLGHVFPIYIGFKGGKGVATLAGMALGLFPLAFLFSLFTFVLVIAITRYVSLGSMLAAVVFPLVLIFISDQQSFPLIALGVFASIFIIFTHRVNLKKLLNGTENKFGAKKT